MADVGRFYSSKGILMVVPMFLMHPLGFQHALQNTFLCKHDSHVLNSTTKRERVNPIQTYYIRLLLLPSELLEKKTHGR